MITNNVLLTAEEEIDLAEKVASGNLEARNQLVNANIGLVYKIASQFKNKGVDYDDIVSDGVIGLITAADRFKPEFKARFSTYACYWINESIRNSFYNTWQRIRVPRYIARLLASYKKTLKTMSQNSGTIPDFYQVCHELKIDGKIVQFLKLAIKTQNVTEKDSFEQKDIPVYFHSDFEQKEVYNVLMKKINLLNTREQIVVSMLYGLNGEKPITAKAIARHLKCTRELVHTIKLCAIKKLSRYMEENTSLERAG